MKTYSGEFDGRKWSSMYPNIYRVKYTSVMTGHPREYEVYKTAQSEHHARQRVDGSHIRGYIKVELVYVLPEDSQPKPTLSTAPEH
jgi:hypothetical protein